jgi:glutamate synthase (NADPH/NADH) small chain
VNRLRKLGVEFKTDFIVGRTATLDELFAQGYVAVFLGTGAGLPWLMGIPGENLIGVYTANEFLTRINLMHADEFQGHTPVLGPGPSSSEETGQTLPAGQTAGQRRRSFTAGAAGTQGLAEEIEHAEEEGAVFEFLPRRCACSVTRRASSGDGVHPHGAGRARRVRPPAAGHHPELELPKAL